MLEDALIPLLGRPDAISIYHELEREMLNRFPQVEIRLSKTQIGFFHGCGFAWAWPPRRKREMGLGLSLGLPEHVENARISFATEPYPGRWTHHLLIASVQDMDEQLWAWVEQAYHFAAFRSRKIP